MADPVRMKVLNALFDAQDAGDHCAELLRMTIPEDVKPNLLDGISALALGVFSASQRFSRKSEPTTYEVSQAMTAGREYAQALDQLGRIAGESAILESSVQGSTWPERIRAGEIDAVQSEVTSAAAEVHQLRLRLEKLPGTSSGRRLHTTSEGSAVWRTHFGHLPR